MNEREFRIAQLREEIANAEAAIEKKEQDNERFEQMAAKIDERWRTDGDSFDGYEDYSMARAMKTDAIWLNECAMDGLQNRINRLHNELDELLGTTHFIAYNGLHGASYPDHMSVHRSHDEAVQSAIEVFSDLLSAEEEESLEQYGYVDFEGDRRIEVGAEMIRIDVCKCPTPWIHDEYMTEDDWKGIE
jgi:Mg/Co/Ni transporter MgtE